LVLQGSPQQHHAGEAEPFAPAQLVTAIANLLNTGTPVSRPPVLRQLLPHQLVESWSFQPIEIALAGSGLRQKMLGNFQRWHGPSILKSQVGENFV
jgi:hypothetical protein